MTAWTEGERYRQTAHVPELQEEHDAAEPVKLGEQIAALLDPLQPVEGVTQAPIRAELAAIGSVTRVGGGTLDPGADDLSVIAHWGYAGRSGITMPARGKAIQRDYTAEERAAILDRAAALDLSPEQIFACLGDATYDVYLNDVAYWRNVPSCVWSYTLGGYQVIKKWLSYRERDLLGRPLKVEEVREVMNIVRRIAAILLLGPPLDDNYEAVKANTYEWPREEQ